MTTQPASLSVPCHRRLNQLHSTLYFSPDFTKALADIGVDDPGGAYCAGRSAAMGAVGPGLAAAAFYNFPYGFLARHLPRVWSLASPAQVLDARLSAADATLRRLLGDRMIASPEMTEAAELALRASEGCTRPGRPLYAAHADLPVPDEPHLAYWHATTLLREYRGDGHTVALQEAGLDGLEALVSHAATRDGMVPAWSRSMRGWSPADWAHAEDRLRARDLLDAAGEPTDAGLALREEVEHRTDHLDRGPYDRLGPKGTERLTELASVFGATVLEAGAFPRAAFFWKG